MDYNVLAGCLSDFTLEDVGKLLDAAIEKSSLPMLRLAVALGATISLEVLEKAAARGTPQIFAELRRSVKKITSEEKARLLEAAANAGNADMMLSLHRDE